MPVTAGTGCHDPDPIKSYTVSVLLYRVWDKHSCPYLKPPGNSIVKGWFPWLANRKPRPREMG